jgi:dCTP deaminase
MTFWSSETLRNRRAQVILTGNPFPEQIDSGAYTLRMGPEVYVTPHTDFRDPLAKVKDRLSNDEQFPIPPGQFAFLLTEETIRLPYNAIGFISIKSGIKFRGLVNISGFHVDPGYHGRLIFSVFNAGPARIVLQRGQPLFLLWIADLDAQARHEDARSKPGFDRIGDELISNIHGTIHSPQSLSKRIDDLDNTMKLFVQKMTIYAGIGVFVITLALNVFVRYGPNLFGLSTQTQTQQGVSPGTR